MFAKIFGQIFDSSIAEDYNCRRMFMDLLVLADKTGAVDMTIEAISRRTNVPVDEVKRYIADLCQPDEKSRSKLEEGKRLIPLDCNRDWGWKIVNYHHYRKIRDEEARRSYFRDKMRKYRARNKQIADDVKDTGLTKGDDFNKLKPSASASVRTRKGSAEGKATQAEVEDFCESIGLPRTDGEWFFWKMEGCGWTNAGRPVRSWQATIRSWRKVGTILPSHKSSGQMKQENFKEIKYG